MTPTAVGFREASARAVLDPTLREAIRRVTDNLVARRAQVTAELPHFNALRDRAKRIKEHTLANLDRYLEQLEGAVHARGGHVHWARDAEEAAACVVRVCREAGARRVAKSKSMVTEEVELNRALLEAGMEPVETDLGEFVVQISGDRPSHLIAPIIHRRREDVAELFARHLGTPPDASVPILTAAARAHLRQTFLGADVGITGANFLVAETGTVVVVENEGNARMVTTLPRVHVAVAGIEKVVPRLADLAVFLPLLVRSATGQRLSAYVSFLTGPRRPGEMDGPDAFHLVLVDNGRSRMLADPELREGLQCIRCSACLNVCPVYERAGGHAYGSVYSGPIGAVLTPALTGGRGLLDLPFASSLCGACRDVCPLRIEIPRMLVALRARARWTAAASWERRAARMAGWLLSRPRLYRWASAAVRALEPLVRRVPAGPLHRWARGRDLPRLSPTPFHRDSRR
ncbi:MAG: LutB/LldF family L-lactate oxidation iron-sulfur protein [Armatimonadota bacterium]|nr:LutB/LldF family L-lactate oxidation iron-sulfur protein [Armatimonadota bacterium]MDR7426332.1 LutB/LldF family L-lactate oxidation iron-sulfur protein [Armatimonadota bacterium]MDR7463241.1 LutB/LldF family L-lactate oxidation iron-sulfur protein [Armatimonadota bacterium]MDR7469184.1 LutB/LldF family L-lactate oxidation iron-sulfur protein [Armatimonadota bacterium]MDR7474545.1 LutB/LldF family L-lactate oxidation iron-sulfur protein [Armatimonadota bacterium]